MPEIKVHLRQSKIFLMGLLSIVIGSCFLIAMLDISLWIKCFLGMSVLLYGIKIDRDQRRVTGLRGDANGWRIEEGENFYTGELCKDSTLTRWVSVLRFSVKGKWMKRTCLVWKDAVNEEDYRKMLVMMRWER